MLKSHLLRVHIGLLSSIALEYYALALANRQQEGLNLTRRLTYITMRPRVACWIQDTKSFISSVLVCIQPFGLLLTLSVLSSSFSCRCWLAYDNSRSPTQNLVAIKILPAVRSPRENPRMSWVFCEWLPLMLKKVIIPVDITLYPYKTTFMSEVMRYRALLATFVLLNPSMILWILRIYAFHFKKSNNLLIKFYWRWISSIGNVTSYILVRHTTHALE